MTPPTLEALADHARANPDRRYEMLSCYECLAAELTGNSMIDHHTFAGNHETVPEEFGRFTQAMSNVAHTEYPDQNVNTLTTLSGAELADAIDDIIDGLAPYDVAKALVDAKQGL